MQASPSGHGQTASHPGNRGDTQGGADEPEATGPQVAAPLPSAPAPRVTLISRVSGRPAVRRVVRFTSQVKQTAPRTDSALTDLKTRALVPEWSRAGQGRVCSVPRLYVCPVKRNGNKDRFRDSSKVALLQLVYFLPNRYLNNVHICFERDTWFR